MTFMRRGRAGVPRFRSTLLARGGANRRLRRRSRPRRAVLFLVVVLGAGLVFLGAREAFEGDLFRVREIAFRGLVNARPEVLLAEAGLARRRSIFDGFSSAEARLRRDPLVLDAEIRRDLPRRLIVEIEERLPAAYWADSALWPVDASGTVLPLQPAHFGWDLPVLMVAGGHAGASSSAIRAGRLADPDARALLRLVVGMRDRVPEIFRRVSAAELRPEGRVVVHLIAGAVGATGGPPGEVRMRLETPLEKVALLPDVIRNLEMKRRSFRSVDLSFADQIVVVPGPLAPGPADPSLLDAHGEVEAAGPPEVSGGTAAPNAEPPRLEPSVAPGGLPPHSAAGEPPAHGEI